MPVLQLIILLLILVLLRSLLPIRNIFISLVISFFLAFIFAIQLSSVILTGEIANYRFYENFNISDVLSVADFFGKEGILLALVLALTTFLIHFFGKRIRRGSLNKMVLFGTALVGIVMMSFTGGILNNAFNTLRLKFAGDASFVEALSSLEINSEDYIQKNEIKASKGKNIIVLSLESLEKGYLGEKLRHLTPNLSGLAKDYTLLNMDQAPAGAWTSASMYIAMTGVPAYFGTHGNSVFQSSHENKLTTLPDVLKKAGYDLQYFIGKKEYSGIDDMLKTHGFSVKSEKDFGTRYNPVAWGIQDMDLFEEFKKELMLKKKGNQPFAFFLSTIGTHFPNGVPDERIDSLLPPQKSRLELMVSATDYFVGDLIAFLKSQDLFENTVFYIYPDHLLMGKGSKVVEDFDERSLYLLTNAKLVDYSTPDRKKINQIDIPKLILKGAGIDHNVQFLTDYIPGEDKNAFLRKNAKSLLQLNDAALTTLNLQDGILISLSENHEKFIVKNVEGIELVSESVPNQGNGQRISLDKEMRPLDVAYIDFEKPKKQLKTPFHLDVFWSNGNLYASLQDKNDLGLLKKGADEIAFSEKDIRTLQALNLEKVTSEFTDGIHLNSNSWNAKKASSFSMQGNVLNTSRGITVVVMNKQKRVDYRTFDTYGNLEDAKELLAVLEELQADGVPYVMLAHDSAAKSLLGLTKPLKNLGFKKLINLKGRQAFIAHNFNDDLTEIIDDVSIELQLDYPKEIENTKLYFPPSKITFEKKVDRYIAHAAGQINGLKYTNSVEAMNFSYKQGFRLFELDISETSDGHFVATHDWNHWKKETNYDGEVPVSLAEFKKHKIRGKYLTLDIDGINGWFSQHPDAILVTDKVNTPKRFADLLVDRNRLVMELFSLKAVEEAIENGIAPLLSEKAIGEIKSDVVSFMIKNKIEYVGMSRRGISAKEAFLKKCRENNIKVYVYHVNFDIGKDEKYVHDNELGLVYGMYADTWLSEFNP